MTKVISKDLTIGTLVRIPEPSLESDTWTERMSVKVDDVVNGNVIFCDDDWSCHEISMDRVEIIF